MPKNETAFALGCFAAFGLSIVLGSAATGCGSYSTGGDGAPFVGTWSCPSLPAGAQTLVIGDYADESLSVQGAGDAGAAPIFCPSDAWTFSGSTASQRSGTSCFGGATGLAVITVQSFSLTVNGSSLTVKGTETISAIPPDAGGEDAGAPKAVTQTLNLSATCKKD